MAISYQWASLRPYADEVASIYGGLTAYLQPDQIHEGQTYDILCRDGLHYRGEVQKKTKKGKFLHVCVHFRHWGPKYDYNGPLSVLYLASDHKFSAADGLNSRNRYTIDESALETPKASVAKSTTTSARRKRGKSSTTRATEESGESGNTRAKRSQRRANGALHGSYPSTLIQDLTATEMRNHLSYVETGHGPSPASSSSPRLSAPTLTHNLFDANPSEFACKLSNIDVASDEEFTIMCTDDFDDNEDGIEEDIDPVEARAEGDVEHGELGKMTHQYDFQTKTQLLRRLKDLRDIRKKTDRQIEALEGLLFPTVP